MKEYTKWILIGTGICLAGYDFGAYLEPTEGDTISEVALEATRKWPLIAWAFGALAGHLFWPSSSKRSTKAKFIGLGALTTFAVLGSIISSRVLSGFQIHPLLSLIFGIVSGHFLWPQTPNTGEGSDERSQ